MNHGFLPACCAAAARETSDKNQHRQLQLRRRAAVMDGISCREAVERADNLGEYFRSDVDWQWHVSEQLAQHERAAGADRGVCAGIRRVGSGFE